MSSLFNLCSKLEVLKYAIYKGVLFTLKLQADVNWVLLLTYTCLHIMIYMYVSTALKSLSLPALVLLGMVFTMCVLVYV